MTTKTFVIVLASELENRIYVTELDEEHAKIAVELSETVIDYAEDSENSQKLVDFVNYIEENWSFSETPITVKNATIVNFYFGV
jgi:hypothetical protein